MIESKNEYSPRTVSPPGETLDELLNERGMSQADLAGRTGRPKKTINEIVKGKAAITPETALQFELVLGVSASFWLLRQQQFDEARARAQENEKLAGAHDWVKELPVSQLQKKGWIPSVREPIERARACLRFFGVASPEQWKERYGSGRARFRQSNAHAVDDGAVAAWLRRGEIDAGRVSCRPFSESNFRGALEQVRPLTRLSPEKFLPQLRELCAKAGVAVVIVGELPGCRASGAAFWLRPEKAVILLSVRYMSNDHLWFSFFHEAGHLLLHGKREIFLDYTTEKEGEEEEQANRFARELLIPPDAYTDFLQSGRLTVDSVERFATKVGIAAGIIVGRLQHERRIPFSQMNGLKVRFKIVEADDSIP